MLLKNQNLKILLISNIILIYILKYILNILLDNIYKKKIHSIL